MKRILIAYKGGQCSICNYNKDIPGAYDFHHINPGEKDFGIATGNKTPSLAKLMKEADKCILVCKNCHAEIHHNEMQEKIKKQEAELVSQ